MGKREKGLMNTSKITVDMEQLFELPSDPEKVLFLSVLLQALLDSTKPSTTAEPDEAKEERRAAKAWFFASIGVTSEDFITVCDLADVEPTMMQGFAYKILGTKEIDFVRKRINTILSNKQINR